MMKVKREHFELHKVSLVFALGCVIFLTWICWDWELITRVKLDEFLAFTLPMIYLYYLVLSMWVANFREIELDAEGVCVHFGKYVKKYYWQEIKEKQLAKIKWHHHKEAVILSRRKTHRLKWFDPIVYNIMCHPFSYMVIYLEDETSVKYGGIYTVDKKEFLKNLDQWNVKLEHIGYVHFWGDKVDRTIT